MAAWANVLAAPVSPVRIGHQDSLLDADDLGFRIGSGSSDVLARVKVMNAWTTETLSNAVEPVNGKPSASCSSRHRCASIDSFSA